MCILYESGTVKESDKLVCIPKYVMYTQFYGV